MQLNGIRISKPWLYPEIMFSMYLKLIGKEKIYETVQKFPSQVCLLDLKISMTGRRSLCIAIRIVHNLTNNRM